MEDKVKVHKKEHSESQTCNVSNNDNLDRTTSHALVITTRTGLVINKPSYSKDYVCVINTMY